MENSTSEGHVLTASWRFYHVIYVCVCVL